MTTWDRFTTWFNRIIGKIGEATTSLKFWTYVTAIVGIAQAYTMHGIDGWQAVQALLAATAIYSGAKAYEDSSRK